MKIFFTFWAILLVHIAHTQTLAWAKQFKGSSNSISDGADMVTDAAGNIYITGYLAGTVDMDPGPGVYNLTQPSGGGAYIAKLDAAGNLVWARQFVGSNVISRSIALDAAGNVYTTGFFQQSADFDPGPANYTLLVPPPYGSHIFISKLDNNGNFVWAKQIGGNGNYYANGHDICIDPLGNVLVAGSFVGTADFDPGPAVLNFYSIDHDDACIVKLDNNGNLVWARQYGGQHEQSATSISTDAAGNVYTTGYFFFATDFDPGPGVYNLTVNGNFSDPFIAKLDASGGFVYAKQIAGTNSSGGNAIQADALGNVYITGNFLNTSDFDPGPGTYTLSAAGLDIFLMKLDAAANFVWAGKLGGPAYDGVRNMTMDGSGNLMLTGNFKETANFALGTNVSNLTSVGVEDIFIAKYSGSGSLLMARQFGGPGIDGGSTALTDALGNIYATGSFSQTVDFDPGPAVYNLTSGSPTNENAYIIKLARCANTTTADITVSACNTYTLNSQVYTSSGTYTQALQNAAGCDSIITLHLTVGGSVNTTTATACDSYFWEGQTYTTSGFYSIQYTDASGCDSIRKLNLIIKNKSNTSISATVCEGQTYAGYSTSGTYTDTYVAANGCDSVRTLVLTVKPKVRTTVQATICEGQTYQGYTTAGTYTNTYGAANGCDSICTLILTVNARKQTTINATICEGESYYAAGAAQITTGEYIDSMHTYLGCDSIIITRLTVNAKPKPNLGPDRSICAGSVVTFNPGVFSSYQWQDGSNGPTFSTGTTGIFWVTVTNNNCTATDSIKIIAVHPAPTHFLKQQDSMCSYDKLVLQPSGNYKSYLWSNGSAQSSITIDAPGRYILRVTDANNCIGQDTVSVYVKECISGVYIPTAFTPNADGKNDVFKALVHGIALTFSLQVYNRYGQLIFETKDPNKAWNGTYQSNLCSSSAYVWVCRYHLAGSNPYVQKGTVALIR